jgi:hypothetical protein
MTQQSALAVAADYSDALVVARRAKNLLVAILLALVLGQVVIFFVARYGNLLSTASTRPVRADLLLQYVTGLIVFLGIALTTILGFVLLLMTLIMVMGRLVGVTYITKAYLWCIVLGVMLFPWQAFLYFPGISGADFRIPGVLFTWAELVQDAKFNMETQASAGLDQVTVGILKWTRFVAGPVIAMIVLMQIHLKSRRGVRQALSETRVAASAVGRA